MKKSFLTFAIVSAGLLAQPPQRDMMHRGPGGPGGPPPDFARDMKVVKGAPYTADLMHESTQVLGDGTKVTNKMAGSVYRDTDGRTRREETGTQGQKSITIFDPVAAVSMSLNSASKIASKHAIHIPADQGAGDHHPGTAVRANRGSGGPGPHQQNRVKEELGNQAIEAVQVQGTRTTTTIPAGTRGNDRDIKIVDEVWFSPDLQVVVQSHHSDPWSGDVTYKLSNIRRADLPHTLFEVPADYQVKEGGPGFHGGQGVPQAVRQ